ncbi:MAG: YbaB/EbfC family nucleoid-associated protein [candidate division Zixibacteria bacterium]|nr:YbaB/EbfC family nucleoid-associated protein [candidate division Zixibacteria bacterium]MDD5426585.1 YbaB/EbfC family nucleoid-associated protein [candidate division Zixibacteria bacterium]
MNKGGLGDMMKQVQKMQAKMEEMQAELEKLTVEASSGGGMVKVVANGKSDIISITIDPEVVNKDDIEMLQDLIVAAVNQAREKAQQLQSEQISNLTGGLKIPGLNLPF